MKAMDGRPISGCGRYLQDLISRMAMREKVMNSEVWNQPTLTTRSIATPY